MREVVDRLSTYLESKKNSKGSYPVGGISEITNVGDIENLLRSELLYAGEEVNGIDLFDIRLLEGETLYYQRDQNQIDKVETDVNILFHSRMDYPSRNGINIYPFFLYAILMFWVDFSKKVNSGWTFNFNITYVRQNARDIEFIKILKTLINNGSRSNVKLYETTSFDETAFNDQEGQKIVIGKESDNYFTIKWDDYEETKIFENENNLLEWIIRGFTTILKVEE